jgi:PAP2 superfamily
MKRILFGVIAALALIISSCSSGDNTQYIEKAKNPEFLHRSMKAITDRIVHDIFSPPVASRIYTYSSVAAYEAARHQDKNFKSLAGQLHGLDSVPKPDPTKEYCFELAATQALLKVGRTLIFSENELDVHIQQVMKEYRETGIPDDVFERSIEYGDQVAAHILAWSSKDNYKQSRSFPKYSIENNPATWKPTPPAYMDAVEPHWNKIRTFVIDSAAQFKPAPPTEFSILKTSQFFKEATEVFEVVKNLSEEQRAIASFWDCNPFAMNVRGHVMFATKKISPGGHWINITRNVCAKSKSTMAQSAEAYARVSLSLVDGFISCWDEKYRSRLIRPESYINQYIDENWVPLLQTPPFPEYTSGHSVISSSASVALTKIFGDNYTFTDSTETEFGMPPRSFTSFYQAAQEAGISRMYGGIHYRPAVENGTKQGKLLGEFIAAKVNTNSAVGAK